MKLQIPGSDLIVNVGTRKQLFFDDYILETTRWICPRHSETGRFLQPPGRSTRTDLDGWTEGVDRIEGDLPGHLLRATAFVTRTVNQPTRYEGNPIMVKTEPWEKDAPHPCKIMHDEEDGIWKMWYLGLKDHITHQYFLMYATSEDGIEWVKPKLGLVKRRGRE